MREGNEGGCEDGLRDISKVEMRKGSVEVDEGGFEGDEGGVKNE